MFRWLKKKIEKRDQSVETLDLLLRSGNTTPGYITKRKALNIPAVAAGINFIASTITTIPIRLYHRVDKDTVEEVATDERLKILNDEPENQMDATQFLKALVTDVILFGNGYAVVDRAGNTVQALYYVDPQYVNIVVGVDHVKKDAWITIDARAIDPYKVMRVTLDSVDGVTGRGILKRNPIVFQAMYNALEYENNSISTGTKRGFLSSKAKLAKDALEAVKAAWKKLTSNGSSNDMVILNEGISFEPINSTATENQLNENKKTNADLVYGMMGLSSELFSNPTNETYNNAIKTGVLPILRTLESAFNKALLLEIEKGSYFFKFDTSNVLRSTLLERYQGYELALKNGWLQVDEVRKMENLPPLGLDFVKLGLADVLYYPKTHKTYTPNTNATASLTGDGHSGGKGGDENNENRDPSE
ncbi:phage portal protein [Acidaminococcus massiliensis]|uniref:phage portal protein n=1 Tax=Acidaminococcus massiliensis TaxID=1852375 RepID=UPI0020525CD9|nr:MAG TPA: portal protein [Caudoviricetes sp.]